jgi:hypothetical protein
MMAERVTRGYATARVEIEHATPLGAVPRETPGETICGTS